MAVIGGYFHGTPRTYTNGDYVDAAEFDNRGNLLVNIAAGEVISATVNAGTINAGTINAATINAGTMVNPVITAANNGSFSVGTSLVGTILASNTNRKFAYLSNAGTADVFLAYTGTSSLNSGLQLNANGGVLEIAHPALYTGVITGVSTGTSIVTFIEGTA